MQILNHFHTSVEKSLSEIDKNWRNYHGLIVCGTHTPQNPEIMIDAIADARESGLPALLICFGYQLGSIDYARNVLGIEDATSEEWGEGTFVVHKRPQLKVGLHDGESWWSNYEADSWEIPENWVAVPYHPEYQSSKGNPHPDLIKFLKYCKEYES